MIISKIGTNGQCQEAVKHMAEMLQLNPGDNQGVRYILGHFLLALDADNAYQELMEKYPDDSSVEFLYNNALFLFKRNGGDGREAKDSIKKALAGALQWLTRNLWLV